MAQQAQQPASSAGGAAPTAVASEQAILNRYCISCHNEKLRTADLALDKADLGNVGAGPQLWEKVVLKLRAGQMPPAGLPRPERAAYDGFRKYLENQLDQAAEARPNPGRPAAFHRLNRAEYANAIRDLVAIELPGESLLPPDDSSSGFDNIGDVLSVSPVLMERYMAAAARISKLAVGDRKVLPTSETYAVPEFLVQNDRISEDLPFGSRGGIAIRHTFPLDGEYTVRIRLQRNGDGFIRGLREPNFLDVRLDGAAVKRFTVGGEYKGRSGPIFSRNDPDYRGDPAQIDYEFSADDELEARLTATAGAHLLQVAFLKRSAKPEGIYTPPLLFDDLGQFRGGEPAVDNVTITGPYNPTGLAETASRRKIFVCTPASAQEEESCATKIVSTMARRAYRRPVTDVEVQDLLSLYKSGQREGGFETGIQMTLQRILAGPEFLFRAERDPNGVPPDTAHRVSDLELASRLSFFLWSSIPDDDLLDLAEQGRLSRPEVLEQQVRRMLSDPRSKALVNNFAGQWLSLRSMRLVSPDPDVYPDFDDNLRQAFVQETALFVESIAREDRSLLDLLRADYTYVNERLAQHYGIPDVRGSHFRRVQLADESRRGLLGKGSLLTVTSYARRTSPVLRGKWVLENFLGTPPPPPPPDVPALEEKSKDGKALTMREQMEQHRASPACAGCHKLMDPIGFALENFDATGKWRTLSPYGDQRAPIDTSGVLPDGTPINGVAEFRDVLLGRPDQFLNTVTGKLLTYALGRELQYYDAPAVRKVLRQAQGSEYRWSSVVLGIVNSVPFQMRRSRPS